MASSMLQCTAFLVSILCAQAVVLESDYTDSCMLSFYGPASEGQVHAQYKLGECYLRAKEHEEATKWLTQASGCEPVQDLQLKNKHIVYECSEVRPDSLAASARLQLATLFYRGLGVHRSLTEAKFLWETLAAGQHPEAEYRLGVYYRDQHFKTGQEMALDWLSKAAAQGRESAKVALWDLQGRKGQLDGVKPEWLELFDVLDTDVNGVLTPREIGGPLLDHFEQHFGEQLAHVDADGDMKIEINEFADWWEERQAAKGDAATLFQLVGPSRMSKVEL